jgi:hypothetical protein
MDDHPGRLVDDEQVLVVVGDPELALLGLESVLVAFGDVDLDAFSALEPTALRSPLAVDPHGAGGEQPLGFRARPNVGQRGDEAIQSLAGCLGWNRNPYD